MKTKIGLRGQKLGMTQLRSVTGNYVPVTAVLVDSNWVSQIKTETKEGYNSCQIAFGDCSKKNINSSQIGHLSKQNISPKKYLCEIRDMKGVEVGSQLNASLFQEGEKVKVSGISKGKGFAGVIKRHNQSRGPMAHGSGYHRGVGSLGSGRDNNRVLKGKKMPGRMGGEKVTVSNLIVEKIDSEKQIIFVRGGVPGPRKSLLTLTKIVA